jgi:hypothetical protein
VALDHEPGLAPALGSGPEWLWGAFPVPLPAVLVEAHLWIVAMNATISLPSGQNSENIAAQRHFPNGG